MSEEVRKVGARCRECGQQLTIEEFRKCSGMGHYCSSHLSMAQAQATKKSSASSRATRLRAVSSSASSSSGSSASDTAGSSVSASGSTRSSAGSAPAGSRRGRRTSANGYTEYSCKAQFARRGEIRSGRLTQDHPSCDRGQAVFVYNDLGFGPGEIATLFIRDPEGRTLAESVGFVCHD